MQSVRVRGRFINESHEPIDGFIQFIPQKIWVEDKDGRTYPTYAPHVKLADGRFDVEVTQTEGWQYLVISPIGRWHVKIDSDGVVLLRDILPKHVI